VAPTVKLSDSGKRVAEQIEQLGFKWEFDPLYPIPDSLDQVQRVQIRNAEHYVPPTEVNKYAAAMKRGDQFPPGVVTQDGRYVDFNTRAAAALKLGWPTFPAFILNVDYASATAERRARVHVLGAAFNSKGNKPLSRDELTRNIREAAKDPDWTPEVVAKHLGVTNSTVSSIFAQFRAEKRAESLGVILNGSVTASNKAALGGKSHKLTDRPFREVARLMQDAGPGMSGRDLRDLLRDVEAATGSEEDKINIVEQERRRRDEQIRHYRAYGKSKPVPSSEVRKRIGYLLDHEGREEALADHNPNTRVEYLRQLEVAAAVLQRVLEIQRTVGDGELV
jgi:hypothetical protein